jgi:hypothetical protein
LAATYKTILVLSREFCQETQSSNGRVCQKAEGVQELLNVKTFENILQTSQLPSAVKSYKMSALKNISTPANNFYSLNYFRYLGMEVVDMLASRSTIERPHHAVLCAYQLWAIGCFKEAKRFRSLLSSLLSFTKEAVVCLVEGEGGPTLLPTPTPLSRTSGAGPPYSRFCFFPRV